MSVKETTRSQSMSIQEVSSGPGGLISTGPDEPLQWIPGASHSREALKWGQTGGWTKHQASHKSMAEYKTLPLAYEEILSESLHATIMKELARMWEMLGYNQGPGKEADWPSYYSLWYRLVVKDGIFTADHWLICRLHSMWWNVSSLLNQNASSICLPVCPEGKFTG